MKHLFLIALLLGVCYTTKAQNMVNNTACSVTVSRVCFDNTTCAITSTCSSVTLAPGMTAPLAPCTTCAPGSFPGFVVCWTDLPCSGTCVTIGEPTNPPPACAIWGLGPNTMPGCSFCGSVSGTVSYNAVGDLIIN